MTLPLLRMPLDEPMLGASGLVARSWRLYLQQVQNQLVKSPLLPSAGGTGVANADTKTLTLGGATVFSGAFGVTLTFTGTTGVTFPTSGTLNKDADITFSDVTTNNVSTTKHGFAPKLPNDATKYLDGTGNYTVPAGTTPHALLDGVVDNDTVAHAPVRGDIIVANLTPKWSVVASPVDATKFLNGATDPTFAQVKDSDLSTSDITTNNVATTKHGFAPKLPNDVTLFLNGIGTYTAPTGTAANPGGVDKNVQYNNATVFGGVANNTTATNKYLQQVSTGTPSFQQVADADLSVTDVTTNNVTSTVHGFAPKSPADATKFLNGAATAVFAQVKDSDLSTSDVTTNDVSTTKHGFAPKSPNDATKYLDGTGAYSVPAGSGSAMVLLGEGEGTDSSAGATNVYTLAISGLTVKDSLRIHITMSSLSNGTAQPVLRNTTDTVDFLKLNAGAAIGNGKYVIDDVLVYGDQSATTVVAAVDNSFTQTLDGLQTFVAGYGAIVSFATAWTGSWTLALRHGGVSAGGTFHYRIAVYKVKGQ